MIEGDKYFNIPIIYSFRDTIGKVHTEPLRALRPPSCTGKFKMLPFSSNACYINPFYYKE